MTYIQKKYCILRYLVNELNQLNKRSPEYHFILSRFTHEINEAAEKLTPNTFLRLIKDNPSIEYLIPICMLRWAEGRVGELL